MAAWGIYGMGQDDIRPEFMKEKDPQHDMRTRLLMGMIPRQQATNPYGVAGNALMAAMLMNPQMMGGIGRGLGNVMNGYQWNGMAGQGMQNQLQNQALANLKGGGPL